jgi:hypothetical protein
VSEPIRLVRQHVDKMRNSGAIDEGAHKALILNLKAACVHKWHYQTDQRGDGWISFRFCRDCSAYEVIKKGENQMSDETKNQRIRLNLAARHLDELGQYLDARGIRRAEQRRIVGTVFHAIHALIRDTPLIDGWDHVRAVRDLANMQGIDLTWSSDERDGLGVYGHEEEENDENQ